MIPLGCRCIVCVLYIAPCLLLSTDHMLEQLHQYEIVVPHMVNHHGEFVSYDVTHDSSHLRRKRRSVGHVYQPTDNDAAQRPTSWGMWTDPDKWVFYKLTAFGMDFHFNLTLNTGLVSPMYSVEYWNESGVEATHKLLKDCHYVGHLGRDHQGQSRVALSNCFGLVSSQSPLNSVVCRI